MQFGFKSNSSCRHALTVLRSTVEYCNKRNVNVTLCAIDISKAIDKTNHFALLHLLMKKNISKSIIGVLLNWFTKGVSCIKWNNCLSNWFNITAGVRQGGLLSPLLFSVYMDTLIARLRTSKLGTKLCNFYTGCLIR